MSSSSPFRITGPAAISFSGGRTSAYMLWRILDAHDGRLPDDVRVVFANTGKEREETLRFVHECEVRWGVAVYWVEWRRAPPGFERVGYNSASRSGEPFEDLIQQKSALPNWQARWCTGYLKVQAMTALISAEMHWAAGEYSEVIGLRYDEGWRVLRMLERNEKHGRRCLAPLAKAKVVQADVMAFWRQQSFDLALKPGEGNCDLCFLKGRGLRKQLIRDNPGIADWWVRMERGGRFFDRRDRYSSLVAEVARQPDLFVMDDEEFDADCGLICAYSEPDVHPG